MKKLVYLIVLFLVLGLIVSGCNPVVPSVEQDELGSQTKSRIVTVQLLDSTNKGLAGGVVQYYSGGWQTFGTTAGVDGKVDKDLPDGTYTFQVSYAGASMQKSQNVASDPVVVFQTKLVTMKLLDSAGTTELSGGAQYYANGWKTFGNGTTTTTMELLPLTYTFQVSYAGASMQKSQNVASDPVVVFQTKLVTMKLLGSTGELAGGAQYYANGWKTFGNGTTTTTMEMLPLTYTFQVSYAGASMQKSQNVASDPVVIFQATKVTLQFSGQIQYYAGGWKPFNKPLMNLLPGTYTFKFDAYQMNITVSGSEMTKSIVIAKLLNSSGGGISGGAAQYYDGGWKVMGTTGSNGVLLYAIDGLKGTLSFIMTYGGASVEKSQNIATDSYVVFQTTEVTMKLLGSNNNELNGGAEYYANGYKTFGNGTTTTTMELLPLTYTFRVSYAGASVEKSQNVASDPVVIFQTGKVNSDSGRCTQYYASGWKTFIQSMELLPGNYAFLFNDGFPQTAYLIVAGVVNSIH